MNISFEHADESATATGAEAVVPKEEPLDHPVMAEEEKPSVQNLKRETAKIKKAKKAAEESDFDPNQMTEEEDPSIPEDDDASFEAHFSGKRGSAKSKRGHRRGGYATYGRLPSRPYAAVQNYESEDDAAYGKLPRKKYSRACKHPAARPILDIDIPSSSSPEEFDETIHVMTKERKLQLEAMKAKELAMQRVSAAAPSVNNKSRAPTATAATTEGTTAQVKAEPADHSEETMSSPAKKPKNE